MKKLFLFTLLLIIVKFSIASHAAGADIQYAYLGTDTAGNSTYRVTVSFYRDCSGISAPNSMNINVKNILCNTSTDYTLIRIDSQLLNFYAPSYINNTVCTGGNLPGYQKYVYESIVNIPYGCQSDYILSISESARNPSTNLIGADAGDLYLEAIINNERDTITKQLLYPNSSASFIADPVLAICKSSQNTLLFMGIDTDGDSLKYEMVAPLVAYNTPVTYYTSLSPQYPFGYPFFFDSLTGNLIVTPPSNGVNTIAVKVSEYRNGKLISSVLRDIQIVVMNCNVTPIIYDLSEIDNIRIIDDATIGVCDSSFFSYKINIGTTVIDSVKINRIIGDTTIFSNLSDTIVIDSNNVQSVILSGYYNGRGNATITVYYSRINGIFQMNYAQTVNIIPTTEKIITDNNAYCGKPFSLKSISSGSVHWMPDSIFSNPFSKNTTLDLFNSSAQMIYLSTACGTDSLWIKKGAAVHFTTSADTFLCHRDTVSLFVAIDSTNAPYTIQWQSSGNRTIDESLSPNDTIINPFIYIDRNTNVIVKVIDSTGCNTSDTINFNLFPQLSIKATTDTFESHNFVKLTAQQNVSPPINSSYILPNAVLDINDATVGTATTIFPGPSSFYPSVYGSWSKSARHQFLIRADEINSANNVIASIALDIAVSNMLAPLQNFTIKMGATNLDSLSSFFVENLQPVYFSPSYTPVSGWNTHILQTAFNWDKKSNIIIDICFTNLTNPLNSNSKLRYTSTSYKSFLYANDPSISVCSGYASISNTIYNYQRPNVKLGMGYQVGTATFDSLIWYPNIGLNAVKDSINSIATACVYSNQTYTLVANNSICQDTVLYSHILATKPLVITKQSITVDSFLFTSNYPIVNWYKIDSIHNTINTIYSSQNTTVKLDTPSTFEIFASYTDTNCNETFFSDTIKIAVYKPDTIIDSTVAINDLVLPIISLFPNPASNYCIAHIENMQKINAIKMTDIYGRNCEVIKVLDKNDKIHLSWKNDLTTGIYFITFFTDTGTIVKSIVVK